METEDTQGQDSGTGNSDLINSFLQNVPEADRPIVEKYVPEWDGNVTKKFQGIHEEYKPYKELGDIETLQQAINIYNNLDNEAFQKDLYNKLHEVFGEVQNNKDEPQSPGATGTDIPPEILDYLNPLRSELGDLKKSQDIIAKTLVEKLEAEKQAADDALLDKVLKDARTKHGDFHEEFVLMRMQKGDDVDSAVKAYQDMVKSVGGSASTPPPPPSISGGNSIPMKPQSIVNADSKDVKDFVADFLKKKSAEQ